MMIAILSFAAVGVVFVVTVIANLFYCFAGLAAAKQVEHEMEMERQKRHDSR